MKIAIRLVDKIPMNYYTPGDPTSSPYEPVMTDLVIYRTGRQDESFPAIVVKTYPNDRVDLTVFSTTGLRHIMFVPYNAEVVIGHDSWTWAPTRETRQRPVKVAEAPAREDNVSVGTEG